MGSISFKSKFINNTSKEIKITLAQAKDTWIDYSLESGKSASNEYNDAVAAVKIKFLASVTCLASFVLEGDKDLTISEEKNTTVLVLSNGEKEKRYHLLNGKWDQIKND